MRKTVIQEGTHTISVYFPPDSVMLVLGRFGEGLTLVFDIDGLKPEFETAFVKDGEFDDAELAKLEAEALRIILAYYSGELQ